MRLATGQHLGILASVGEVAADAVKGLLVDHRAHEVPEVGDVAHADIADHLLGAGQRLLPQRLGNVHAAGRRALLSLVLEGAAHHGHRQCPGVGGGMGDYEVLAASLADDARVRAIPPHVPADRLPQRVEDASGAVSYTQLTLPTTREVET